MSDLMWRRENYMWKADAVMAFNVRNLQQNFRISWDFCDLIYFKMSM